MTPAFPLRAPLAFACALLPLSSSAAEGDLSIVEVAGRRVAGAYHAVEASGARSRAAEPAGAAACSGSRPWE